ncbi:hypothetical protein GCM10010446_46940 [Streptomyces enissocaesilis]|uniref:Twin-arginine translocation signal domain-containing protein n=1 Tax=Streptomyces enissocaesilis TaxID=332589 RepID=A0ABP6JZ75_9ACTN
MWAEVVTDMRVPDRRRFLTLTAAASATPLPSACGAGFGGDEEHKGGGSAADDVTGSFDRRKAKGRTVASTWNSAPANCWACSGPPAAASPPRCG